MNIETWTQEDGYGWTDPNGLFVLKIDHDALIREAREMATDIVMLSEHPSLRAKAIAFLDKTKEST
jgi:hypothetical protein